MRLRPRALVNLITVACLLLNGQAIVSAEDFQSFKPPGKFVYLDSHVMYVDCLGESAPTVLIDVGLGDSSANWYKLARKLSRDVRVCVYDRSGYGWSSTGPAERSTAQITFELNQLLERADIPGPYVIVGHSFGGFTARYFASNFPDKTAGLVLVESSHPEQIYRLSGLETYQSKEPLKIARREPAPDDLNEFEKRWYALNSSRKATFAQMEELRSFKDSAYQVKHSGPLPNVPLAVLSRGKTQLPEIDGVSLEQEWQEMQVDLLSLSSESWRVIAKDSGHKMYADDPDVIISNVLKVVNRARNNTNHAGQQQTRYQ